MKQITITFLITCCLLLSACGQNARSIGIIGGSDGPTGIIVANEQGDTVKEPLRMFKADGKLYYDSGMVSNVTSRCGTLDGELKQVGYTYEIPQNDNECNFEGADGYQNVTSITKEVPIDDKWVIFKLYDESKNVAQYDISDFKYCFYLKGRMPNAEKDTEIIMLTEDANCTFEDHMKLFSSYYNHDGKDYKFTVQPYRTSDQWGISLSSKDVTKSGLTILFEQFGGSPSGELQTGEAFSLDVMKNGKWEPVKMKQPDAVWHSIAYKINKNDITELKVDWEWLYGELPTGYYRLKKEVMDFRAAGDFDKEVYGQNFTID